MAVLALFGGSTEVRVVRVETVAGFSTSFFLLGSGLFFSLDASGVFFCAGLATSGAFFGADLLATSFFRVGLGSFRVGLRDNGSIPVRLVDPFLLVISVSDLRV